MATKWWAVRARVQAETLDRAMQTIRRLGTMPENLQQIDDIGQYVYEGGAETASPWKPSTTAPRDGKPFIAFDRNIGLVETAHWDGEQSKFVNDVGDREVLFTQWIEQPD